MKTNDFKYGVYHVLCIVFLLLIVSGCQKENSCENCGPGATHKPPVAKAGTDHVINLPIDSTLLTGMASYDPDGSIASYSWSKISGPPSIQFRNPAAASTMLNSLTVGIYLIELKVTDNDGLTGRDTLQVIVNAGTLPFCDPSGRTVINATVTPVTTIPGGNYTATVENKMFFLVLDCNNHCDDTTNSQAYFNIYDINSQTWSVSSVHSMKTRFTTTICTGSNRIFIAGGYNSDDFIYRRAVTDVDIYNITANSWSVTNLNGGKYGMASAFLNNNFFFAGGYYEFDPNNYYVSNKVEVFNLNNNTWSTHILSEGRNYLSASVAGEKIFFAGGINALNEVVKTVDVFDHSTNSWSLSNLLEPKAAASAVVAGNNIYWAGGAIENRREPTGYSFVKTQHVEIKDLNTGSSFINCLFQANYVVGAQKNNQLVFLGTGGHSVVKNKFDIFDLMANTWSIGLLPVDFVSGALVSVNNTLYIPAPVINGAGSSQIWKLEY